MLGTISPERQYRYICLNQFTIPPQHGSAKIEGRKEIKNTWMCPQGGNNSGVTMRRARRKKKKKEKRGLRSCWHTCVFFCPVRVVKQYLRGFYKTRVYETSRNKSICWETFCFSTLFFQVFQMFKYYPGNRNLETVSERERGRRLVYLKKK